MVKRIKKIIVYFNLWVHVLITEREDFATVT